MVHGPDSRRTSVSATWRPNSSVASRASTTADRKSTRLNSSHGYISYAVFCLKKKKQTDRKQRIRQLLHERRHAYAAIPHQVNTTGYTPEQIVAHVQASLAADVEAHGMTSIPV